SPSAPSATGPRADTDGWPKHDAKTSRDYTRAGVRGQRNALIRRWRRHRSDADRLTNFDEVAVGVAHVGADLPTVILGFREELRALGGPIGVRLVDVRDADIQEGARPVRVGWRRPRDRRLVVRRSSALVENQPRVGDPHDHRVTLDEDIPVKQ